MPLLIVDSDRPLLASTVAQGVVAALRAAGTPPCWRWRDDPTHPLRRPWNADEYGGPEDHALALSTQCRNFALRAAHDDTEHWVLDGGLLHGPGSTDTPGSALLEALAEADPAWLFVRAAGASSGAGDRLFAAAQCRRVMVNAGRAGFEEAVHDGLTLLGASAVRSRGRESEADLAGEWIAADRTITLAPVDEPDGPLDRGPGGRWRLAGQKATETGTMIACEPGVYLISGLPLRLELHSEYAATTGSSDVIGALSLTESTGGSDAEPTVFVRG